MIEANKSVSLILTRAGIVEYYCRFHPKMKGTDHHHAGVKCLAKLAVISTHLVRRSMIVDRILDIVSRRLAHFLPAPIKGYRPIVTCECLAQVLLQGTFFSSKATRGYRRRSDISPNRLGPPL
jgi:hypothetical protein